jgi:hypothetical protein
MLIFNLSIVRHFDQSEKQPDHAQEIRPASLGNRIWRRLIGGLAWKTGSGGQPPWGFVDSAKLTSQMDDRHTKLCCCRRDHGRSAGIIFVA